MKRNRRRDGNFIILRFLVPYVIILLIPLAIGLITYNMTFHVLEEEVVAKNMRVLEQSRDTLDRRFLEIDMIVQQLIDTPKIYNYQSVSKPFVGVTTYKTVETVKELYDYRLSNNFIYDYYIYYNKSDVVLSANSTYLFSDFYNQVYNYESMTAQEWKQVLTSTYYHKKFLPSQLMKIKQHTSQSMITYIQSMGFSKSSRGTLVVLLDNAEIQKMLRGLVVSKDSWAYIADETGQVITSISSNEQQIKPIAKQSKTQGLIEQKINSHDVMITYTTSKNNGWTYVVMQPSYIVLDKLNYIRKITVSSVMISLLLGIFIAYYMAYRNSKPLKTLIGKILEKFEGEPPQSKDAYGLIEGTLSLLSKNNDELEKKMQEQIPILRLTFFEHLLKGEYTSEKAIERQLHHIGIEISGNFYTVVIIHLKHYKNIEETMLNKLDKSRVLVKEVLVNVMHEQCFVHDVGEDKIAILYTCLSGEHLECRVKLKTTIDKVGSLISNQLNIPTAIAVGGIYNQITQVSRSYEDARKTLNKSIFLSDRNTITWYEDIPHGKNKYYYPADLEGRLINFVKSGDENEAMGLLEQLYKENFIDKQLSLPILKLFLYDMMGTIMKLMDHVDKHEEIKVAFIESMVDELESDKDLARTFQMIETTYSKLCHEVNERKKSRNVDLKSKITEYIHSSYSQPELNLSMVADHFNMSEVYLSHFYKEQTGENFSEYLEKLRMAKAKELLIGDEYSVNEISYKVGYNTTNTFGRAFKRIHGISATAFKKSI